jgi:hypothetical protein
MQYHRIIILSLLFKEFSAISACLIYNTYGLGQYGFYGGSLQISNNKCYINPVAVNISYVELQLATTQIDYNSLANLPNLPNYIGLIALILAVLNSAFLIALAIYVKAKLNTRSVSAEELRITKNS